LDDADSGRIWCFCLAFPDSHTFCLDLCDSHAINLTLYEAIVPLENEFLSIADFESLPELDADHLFRVLTGASHCRCRR
jgi:hypothetical protein